MSITIILISIILFLLLLLMREGGNSCYSCYVGNLSILIWFNSRSDCPREDSNTGQVACREIRILSFLIKKSLQKAGQWSHLPTYHCLTCAGRMSHSFILCGVDKSTRSIYYWAHKDLPPKHYQLFRSPWHLTTFRCFTSTRNPPQWRRAKRCLLFLKLLYWDMIGMQESCVFLMYTTWEVWR